MAVRGSRNQKFSKEAQKNSAFGKAISAGLSDSSKRLMNAIEFIEGPTGIGVTLRPVQRVITKCIFGVPLDYRPAWADRIPLWGMVEMWDTLRENLIRTVTEEEYLHIAFNEGRCNIDDWRDIPNLDKTYGGYNEACIFAGRRGGKSELVAAITCYKLYLLLNVRSPQEYFGLVPGSPIDITYLAQDEKGADRLFKKLREDVNRAAFFEPFLMDNNTKALTFVSEADRHKRDITPTITVWSLPCVTNAVRGPSSVFLALDEFAHFRSEKGSTSEDMYASATPATGDFHHTERTYEDGTTEAIAPTNRDAFPEQEPGDFNEDVDAEYEDIGEKVYDANKVLPRPYKEVEVLDSMIFSISSPLKKVGKMFELHKLALDEGHKSSIFTLNCSSAEMNNKLPTKFLKSEYKKSKVAFRAEYGGQFLESSESYVTEMAIKTCTDCKWDDKGGPVEGSARLNAVAFNPMLHLGRNYFWGFDLGMTHDASALAIAHLEYGGGGGIRLVYDYIDRMMVGEVFEGPGVSSVPGERKYDGFKVLPLEDIMAWLKFMNKIFPCYRGATDQHGGQQLVQLFELNAIFNMELLNLTPAINSQMAYALMGYIDNKLCSFPYVPRFIKELKLVELEVVTKYRIRVQAPMEKGAHDDMVDACQLVALLAQRWLVAEGHGHLDPKGISLAMAERAARPPAPLASIDGLSLQQLKVAERVKKVSTNLGYAAGGVPVSPFSRRGGRGRR